MSHIADIHRTEITWEGIWSKTAWRIEDVAVFDHLRSNGYHYKDCGAGIWYRVDIPYIGWGGSLPLADGFTLELNGTLMEIIPPTRLVGFQPKDEHPMQEIWDCVKQEQRPLQRIWRTLTSIL